MSDKVKYTFPLPCGYVDPNGNIHREICLRGMSGAEDDILDDNDLSVTERLTNVLTACTESIGRITDRKVINSAIADDLPEGGGLPITAQDRIAALIYLRRATLGDTFKFERRCPRCGELNKNKMLDLRTIKIAPVADPKKRRVQVKLPRSGKNAILKVLTASGEALVAQLKPAQKDLKSHAIMARLETIDDRRMTGTAEDVEIIKTLPQEDRSYLILVYQLMEGNVDTNVQVTCKNGLCGAEFEFPLDLGQLFFTGQAKQPTADDLTWL